MISISCVLYRRVFHPELLVPCRWSLGRWGIVINVLGLLYATHAFFWCFWPESTPTTPETFNWASVMFVGVSVACLVDYVLRGRKRYKGPVVLVRS